jgi:hypothetical protein
MVLRTNSSVEIVKTKFLKVSFGLGVWVGDLNDLYLAIHFNVHLVTLASGSVCECAYSQ